MKHDDGSAKVDQRSSRSQRIAQLNDRLRKEGRGGRLVVTQGLCNLPGFDAPELIRALAAYDEFGPDNDPYEEHDFGAFELFGAKLLWKIDYYDLDLEFGSKDPADPDVTCRVLTVMLNHEY